MRAFMRSATRGVYVLWGVLNHIITEDGVFGHK